MASLVTEEVKGLLDVVTSVVRTVIYGYEGTLGRGNSLADISKIARIEPITLISSGLSGTKEMYEILHGILNVYAAYYLQAVNIMSAQLADVRILKILDATNPDRTLKTLLATAPELTLEHREELMDLINIKSMTLGENKFKLPMIKKESSLAFEALDDTENYLTSSINRIQTFEKLGPAVGKVIEVNFDVQDRNNTMNSGRVSIPTVVKLDTMIIPSQVISAIISSNTDEIRLGARFKAALSGRINFIKDFILASDLIRAQKKAMIKDPTGYYSEMLKRLNKSRMMSVLSGNVSLAGVSAVVVISEEDEEEIQKKIGGKLTNQTTRKMVFDNISAMMLVVVDREWERVSVYVRDMGSFSQSSFESFQGMDKKANNNISDFLKAFSLNNAPSF